MNLPTVIMILYFLPSVVVCAFCVDAINRDEDASIHNPGTAIFTVLAALLWPVTLPSILAKKVQTAAAKSNHQQALADD